MNERKKDPHRGNEIVIKSFVEETSSVHPTETSNATAWIPLSEFTEASRDSPRLFNISHLSASKCQQLPSYESYHLHSFQNLSVVAVVNIAFG